MRELREYGESTASVLSRVQQAARKLKRGATLLKACGEETRPLSSSRGAGRHSDARALPHSITQLALRHPVLTPLQAASRSGSPLTAPAWTAAVARARPRGARPAAAGVQGCTASSTQLTTLPSGLGCLVRRCCCCLCCCCSVCTLVADGHSPPERAATLAAQASLNKLLLAFAMRLTVTVSKRATKWLLLLRAHVSGGVGKCRRQVQTDGGAVRSPARCACEALGLRCRSRLA